VNDLQVVGDASDELEGVQKAEEIQPEIIVLDIGPQHVIRVSTDLNDLEQLRLLPPLGLLEK
jgi:chemotaxis response regulator CheB